MNLKITKNPLQGKATMECRLDDYHMIIRKALFNTVKNLGFEVSMKKTSISVVFPTNLANANLLNSIMSDIDTITKADISEICNKITEDGDYYYHQNHLFSKVGDMYYLVREDGTKSFLYLKLKNVYHIGTVCTEIYDNFDDYISSLN